MKITEAIFPDSTIIYRSRVGAYGKENKILMEDFKRDMKKHALLLDDSVFVAIAYDNPYVVKPDLCRYDVGLLHVDVTTEMDCKTIQGGKYLVFEIEHTEKAIETLWTVMLHETEKLGHQFDPKRVTIERYQESKIRKHRCEICVPIQ